MRVLKNNLFLIFLTIYLAFFTVFVGKTLLEVSKKPISIIPSSIPSLSVSKLDKISAKLEEREKIEYAGEVDLTKIQFGKLEPFSP